MTRPRGARREILVLADIGITDLVVDVDWTDQDDPRRTLEIIQAGLA